MFKCNFQTPIRYIKLMHAKCILGEKEPFLENTFYLTVWIYEEIMKQYTGMFFNRTVLCTNCIILNKCLEEKKTQLVGVKTLRLLDRILMMEIMNLKAISNHFFR